MAEKIPYSSIPFDTVASTVLDVAELGIDVEYYQQLNSDGNEAFVDRLKIFVPNAKDITDVGARYGSLTYKLKEAWKYANVIGLDASSKSLIVARFVCPGAQFIEHDINNPFPVEDESQDVVVSLETLKYLKTAPWVIANMMRALKQGGVIGFSVGTHDGERVEARGSFSPDGHKTASASIPIYSHPFKSIEEAVCVSGGVILNENMLNKSDPVWNIIIARKMELNA